MYFYNTFLLINIFTTLKYRYKNNVIKSGLRALEEKRLKKKISSFKE